jgi:hypothetical protein
MMPPEIFELYSAARELCRPPPGLGTSDARQQQMVRLGVAVGVIEIWWKSKNGVEHQSEPEDNLPYRVDVCGSGGWQHLASFAGEADAYEYGERYAFNGVRVWHDGKCIAVTYGRRSWRAPHHNRNCNGDPCECGEVPPIGSHARRGE